MTDKPKIFLGVPQPEDTHHWFQESVWNLTCASMNDYMIQRYHAVGSVIAVNRNRLVRAARDAQADYLLQIDADSVFPPDALKRLIEHNVPIIGATTTSRDGRTNRPMCQPINRDKVYGDSAVIPVQLIGMNFMLIKMDVFDKLEAPWYAEPPRMLVFADLSPQDAISLPELVAEDEYFCIKARNAGYEVLCDMLLSMEMGHIGSKVFYINK
jgi:hypothetical protein